MVNVIEFNEFSSTTPGAAHEVYCWLCQKGQSARAFFCQHCGTIQPVRPIDHFARLGLERRIDIDQELLDRQYTNFQRSFAPERYAIRGLGERTHAAKQLEALEEAYMTLRDPLKRGRYWLTLHEAVTEMVKADNPMVAELRRDMQTALVGAQCDRLAQKAGQALEQGIVGLMQALRGQNWQLANALLSEVEDLESVLTEVREKRTGMTSSANPWPPTATSAG